MIDCENCRWGIIEKDTNSGECTCPENELEGLVCDCPYFYSNQDAKDDAKYGGRDRY
jgi:hypothetical protein